MKLRDKQFWLYEAVVIICSAISMVILWATYSGAYPFTFRQLIKHKNSL